MVTIRRILLPTDFSDLAAHAAPYARSLADLYDAELHVVHVVTPVPTAVPGTEGTGVGLAVPTPEETARTEAALAEFTESHCAGRGHPVVTGLLHGRPESAVCRYARDHAIDLIVIGTHARGVVARIFLGSVSKWILENAGCPILMIPLVRPEGGAAALAASENIALDATLPPGFLHQYCANVMAGVDRLAEWVAQCASHQPSAFSLQPDQRPARFRLTADG